MAIVKMGIQDESSEIKYDNIISGLNATNVKDAIDELKNTFAMITSYAAMGKYGSTYVTSDAPTIWTSMNFNIIDEQTDINTIELDVNFTERIKIKENGIYLIGYRINVDDEIQGRIIVNNTTIVAGSYAKEGDLVDPYWEEPETSLSHSVSISLTAGDYVSFQYKSATSGEKIILRDDRSTNFSIIKISGIRGVPGTPGTGSTVNIKNNGIYVPFTPFNTLDFVGSLITVTGNDSGIATVEINNSTVTKNYFHAHNNTTTQTLTTAFVTAIIGTSIRCDAIYSNTNGSVTVNKTGNFKITYDISATTTGSRSTLEIVLQINDTNVPGSFAYSYHRSSDNGEDTASGTVLVSLTYGDIVRVRIREINGTIITKANACRLTIEEIN